MIPQIYDQLKTNQIVVALATVLVAYLLWLMWPVLVIIFIAFILTVALLPLVDFLHKRRLPRGVAVLVVYLGLSALTVGFGYLLFPPLVDQLQVLVGQLPQIINQIPLLSGVQIDQSLFSFLQEQVSSLQQIALSATSTVVSILAAIIAIIVINIYWLADYANIREFILRQFGERSARAEKAMANVERRLGGWIRGQLLLSLAVAILYLIAYLIIGLPAALPLALLAGILEIIPVLGPTLAAIPALLIAFTVSPQTVIVVLIAYLVIQQIEGNFLAPKIMSRAAHLHPLAVLIVLLVGSELGGLLGILLAVPFALFMLAIQQVLQQKRSAAKNP